MHVPDWIDLDAQQGLVDDFRAWALPPAGLRHPRVPTGHPMSVQSVCLGWHWHPPGRLSLTVRETGLSDVV